MAFETSIIQGNGVNNFYFIQVDYTFKVNGVSIDNNCSPIVGLSND